MTILIVLRPSKSSDGPTPVVVVTIRGGKKTKNIPSHPVTRRKAAKKHHPKVSAKEFFSELESGYFKPVWDLDDIREIEDEAPMQFLKDFFGTKLPDFIRIYGKKYMLQVRLMLLALLAEDDDDDDE